MLCIARISCGAVLALTVAAGPGQEPSRSSRIDALLEELRDELIEFRRDLHRHPEASGQEERTARVVTARLRSLGLDVRTGMGGHGVVAVLHGRRPGRTLAFRADMDAVSSNTHDPVPFRSERAGVRHICGHDIHTTVGVALALALHAVRDAWSGTVVFYFQPEEENARGARKMIAAGCLEDPRPEACYAYHCSPLPVGSLGVTPGQALPQRDPLRVLLSGAGDLAAAAATVRALIIELNTLEDPQTAPSQLESFVVANVFSAGPVPGTESWTVRGMVTASSAETSAGVQERLERGLRAAGFLGIEAKLEYDARLIPGVLNDAGLLESARKAILSMENGPEFLVSHGSPPQFSEDFGAFQERFPGVMFWLGVSNPDRGTHGRPHSPEFVADEEAIFVGAQAMAAILLDQLSPE